MKIAGSRFVGPRITLALGLLLAGRESSAATVTWNVLVEGCQEVPPNVTNGQGNAALTYDTVTNVLSYNITFAGLSSAELFSHIHGPSSRGVDAGVLFTLPNGSPKVGTANLSEAQETNLLAGLLYVNIHSGNFSGGEIRGQIDNLGACTDPIFEDGFDPGLTEFESEPAAAIVPVQGVTSLAALLRGTGSCHGTQPTAGDLRTTSTN